MSPTSGVECCDKEPVPPDAALVAFFGGRPRRFGAAASARSFSIPATIESNGTVPGVLDPGGGEEGEDIADGEKGAEEGGRDKDGFDCVAHDSLSFPAEDFGEAIDA